jgi:uncharacterized protein Smg (DUF494 family)
MLSRLIEMVSFLLSHSLEYDDEEWGVLRTELHEQLEVQGFHGPEIDIAFEVANKIRLRIEDGTTLPPPLKTNRVYEFLEELKLTREARGYLLTLEHNKAITPEQREEVVDRAFSLDMMDVGVPEIQYLVNFVTGGENWQGEDSPVMSYTLQ